MKRTCVTSMYSRFVASRINKELTPAESLGSAFLGLVCEAGEAGDIIKKYLYQGQPLDREKLLLELGDVRFYLEWCCQLLRTSVPEIEELNIEKLEKRYPTGFVANVKRGDE